MRNRQLKTISIFTFLSVLAPFFVQADILRLNLYYDNGNLFWNKNSSVHTEYFDSLNFLETNSGNYTGKIFSFDNQLLKSFKIIIQPGRTVLGQGFIPQKTGEVSIDAPYYPSAALIKIEDNSGNVKLTADISSFAQCNQNDICEPGKGENLNTCDNDCKPAGDNSTPAKSNTSGNFIKYLVYIISGLVLIFVLWLLKKRRDKLENNQNV